VPEKGSGSNATNTWFTVGVMRHTRLDTVVETACVVVVVAAFLALLVWILIHHGGGVLNQG
jgi:hypothetical protein